MAVPKSQAATGGAGSPAVRAGVNVADNGGVDYAGATIPSVPDVGALQHG